MSRRNSLWSSIPTLAVIAAALAAAACGKKQPPAQPPAPQPAPPPAAGGPNQDSLMRAQRTADSLAAESQRMAAAVAAARNTITAPVYFDLDKSDLTEQAKAVLDAKAPILSANPGLQIRIAGNCDARGSDEYNLALGQRRAATVKRYLTDHGVDGARVDLISYGKERPAVEGDSEDAYAKNRRDEFEITAGADNLKPARS
jgi:peptidoglycan-associated lipoprotein